MSLIGRILPSGGRSTMKSLFRSRLSSPAAQYTTVTTPVQTPAAAVAKLEEESQSDPHIHVFDTISQFRSWRRSLFREGKTLGLVPTMGALHEGHLDLVREATRHVDHVAVSIFVNPAQFAPHEDLAQYPRTVPTDIEALSSLGALAPTAVLIPSVAEMYPSGISLDVSQQQGTFVSVHGKSHQLEGVTRPHFFRGVATVCTKLFNIAQPDAVFFGQKDIQQCMVIRTLLRDLQFPTQMHIVPTTRENDGLAMSSRNRYLTSEQRAIAPTLYHALSLAKAAILEASAKGVPISHDDILETSRNLIEKVANDVSASAPGWEVKLDYLSVADPETLNEIETFDSNKGAILSGAYWVGTTRLIDNLLVNVDL